MLSTKDLKYQMVRRRTEKLTKRFIGLYKIKEIVSSNVVKLELPSTVKTLDLTIEYIQFEAYI